MPPDLTDHLTVVISPAFWKGIAAWKLDTVKTVPKATRDIYAYYSLGREGIASRLRIDETSFQLSENYHIKGKIELYDTIESFQDINVNARYEEACTELLASLNALSDDTISNERLFPFTMLAHCDLKRHVYRYHFLLPTLYPSDGSIRMIPSEHIQVRETLKVIDDNIYMADPSPPMKLSWLARNTISVLFLQGKSEIRLFSCRQHSTTLIAFTPTPSSQLQSLPYEASRLSKTVDLSAMLDPIQLSREASELNLRLMKWRIVPELDLGRHLPVQVPVDRRGYVGVCCGTMPAGLECKRDHVRGLWRSQLQQSREAVPVHLSGCKG